MFVSVGFFLLHKRHNIIPVAQIASSVKKLKEIRNMAFG